MRQGVRSTKVVDEDAMLGAQPTPGVKHKDVYLRVFNATKKTMYSDQTRRFPITYHISSWEQVHYGGG